MAVVCSKVLLIEPPLIYTAPDTCVFGAVHGRVRFNASLVRPGNVCHIGQQMSFNNWFACLPI